MIVAFFGLGPLDSPFSIPALQITDSYYVAHSEKILYRSAYQSFKKQSPQDFFKFFHSAGALKNGVSSDVDKRRIYIDLTENTVYSVNTQYAGNTVGLKKPALRLAIQKASREGWLAEHMFVMAINGRQGKRKTYFTGAFPSACGKTSTAMVPGERIVGDDIAYLREINGSLRAVNVEEGVFGIIQDINSQDDPLIWEAVTTPGEVILTNILVTDKGVPRWLGDGRPQPSKGYTFCGEWTPDKKDEQGNKLPYAHKNARYTISLKALANCDQALNDPQGVEVSGIIYGGRDSSAWFPVCESFNWVHGVVTKGASLESEVTFATLDREGERVLNPFSNLDFLSIPLSKYVGMHLEFGKKFEKTPPIFAVNYFLRDEQGKFLNSKEDKHVWLRWMELRVHGEVKAIKTPLGYIPEYDDLKKLFRQLLNKEYSEEQYLQQFSLRVKANLEKIDRIEKIYKTKENVPSVFFEELASQKKSLSEAKSRLGEVIAPHKFKNDD